MSKDLNSANSHRDGGCPNHNPRNCHFLMSQISTVPTLTNLAGVLLTIHELSLLLMLQIPKMQTIIRIVHVFHHPDHGGEGKDLNDLARMVTVIQGRQPPTHSGGGGLNVFSKRECRQFGQKTHPPHHRGGRGHDPRRVVVFNVADPQNATHHEDGALPPLPRPQKKGKDLNDLARMVTVIEGSQPPTLQGKEGDLNIFSKTLGETALTTPGGGKDLNYLTIMEESKPTKPQGGRRICLTSETCSS